MVMEMMCPLQDVGTRDPFTSSDEWYQYGAEKKEAVEKYCSSVRTRDLMSETLSQTLPSSSGSKEEVKIENATTGSREEDIPKSSAEEYCIQEVYIFLFIHRFINVQEIGSEL